MSYSSVGLSVEVICLPKQYIIGSKIVHLALSSKLKFKCFLYLNLSNCIINGLIQLVDSSPRIVNLLGGLVICCWYVCWVISIHIKTNIYKNMYHSSITYNYICWPSLMGLCCIRNYIIEKSVYSTTNVNCSW